MSFKIHWLKGIAKNMPIKHKTNKPLVKTTIYFGGSLFNLQLTLCIFFKLLTNWSLLKRLIFKTMWCAKCCWFADFPSKDEIFQPCGVCILVFHYLSFQYTLYICVKSCWLADFDGNERKNSNTCGVWNGADLLTLN